MSTLFEHSTPLEQDEFLDIILNKVNLECKVFDYIRNHHEKDLQIDEFMEWLEAADELEAGIEWVPKYEEDNNVGAVYLRYRNLYLESVKNDDK